MKAKYIKEHSEYTDLILGQLYTVEDVKCDKQSSGRHYGNVTEIQIIDTQGEKHWYKAEYFELHAEAVTFLQRPAAVEAHQPILQPILKEGSVQFYNGMNHEQVVACGIAAAAGIAQGIKNPDKELQKKISASIDAHIQHLRMYGA